MSCVVTVQSKSVRFVIVVGVCLLCSGPVNAQTVQTEGAGSAVSSIDRQATFDSRLFSTIRGLTTFDPFHGANSPDRAFYSTAWGNEDWVTIQTTDAKKIFAVEFMYGNGWTTGNPSVPWGNNGGVVDWQTWNGDIMSYFGTLGGATTLEMGTILGFYDPAGFDRLLVRCTHPNSGDPLLQVIALDNLHVQLTDCSGVNNCSGNGTCVATNTCNCFAGWTGPNCATPSCAGVNNCSAHGTCIAPDTCQCNIQWMGPDCATGPIPAVSEWGMIALFLAVMAVGAAIVAKRTARAAQSN